MITLIPQQHYLITAHTMKHSYQFIILLQKEHKKHPIRRDAFHGITAVVVAKSSNVWLGALVGFETLLDSNYLKDELQIIRMDAIDAIKPFDFDDAPLFVNWHYLDEAFKNKLFNM